jgi:hypothetical protein
MAACRLCLGLQILQLLPSQIPRPGHLGLVLVRRGQPAAQLLRGGTMVGPKGLDYILRVVNLPQRQVRATFDSHTITMYQAYSPAIAQAAVATGRFVPPFKRSRMTWIKPSFLWMMYRSGWATKPGQERVLAIRITRAGFEEALSQSCLTHFDKDTYVDYAVWRQRKEASLVRVQWDPERDVALDPLPWRSLQVGLKGVALDKYVDQWIVDLRDITEKVHNLKDQTPENRLDLPVEAPYPLPASIAATIGAALP